MVEQRTQREFKTREKTTRKKTWAPPTQLPDPKPERGFSFRWVRVSLLGQEDARNVSIRFREGWEPVKSEEHPELVAAYGLTSNVNKSGEQYGNVLWLHPVKYYDSYSESSSFKASNFKLMREV